MEANNYNNDNEQNNNNNTITIRHSGHAHVRGRIRRIWRPRYMELLDDGSLLYYEDIFNKIIKYTILVQYTRILDVTTLRDIHVGLPKGTFGFLIRGQRIMPNTNNSNSNNIVDISCNSSNGFILPDTSDNNEVVIRDYLCAVDTLEDAQMWVVALQWAANTINNNNINNNNNNKRTTGNSSSGSIIVADPWWKVDYFQPGMNNNSNSNNNTKRDNNNILQQTTKKKNITTNTSTSTKTKTTKKENIQTITTTTTGSSTNTDKAKQQQAIGNKTLITKVTGYRIIKNNTWYYLFDIAYEIHVLLIENNNSVPTTAKEWTIYRTIHDIENVINNKNRKQQKQKQNHNILLSTLSKSSRTDHSILIVDSILRSWVLSIDMINNQDFQSFLNLHHTNDSSSSSSSTITVIKDNNKDAFVKQWLMEMKNNSIKQQNNNNNNNRWWNKLLFQLHYYTTNNKQHWSIWAVGGAAATTAAVFVYNRTSSYSIPTIQIRLDSLVWTWIGAAYLGHRFSHQLTVVASNNNNNNNSRQNNNSSTQQQKQHKSSVTASTRKKGIAPTTKTGALPKKQHIITPVKKSSKNEDDDNTKSSVSPQGDSSAVIVEDDTQQKHSNHDIDNLDDFCSTGSQEEEEEEEDINSSYDDDNDEDASDATGESSGMINDEQNQVLESGYNIDNSISEMKRLSSPLPKHPDNGGCTCWSQPNDNIFHVRGINYFNDKVKISSGPGPLKCRGVDIFITDNPERHIARHPAVLGGKLNDEDTFLVNFLLPFGNFVSYFTIPKEFHNKQLHNVWLKFLKGDQEYRDARLKLLPVVIDGPWIVKTAVGPGKSPALLGKVIPLQYFFRDPDITNNRKGIYEIDVIITASAIAKGILSVVKSQTKSVTIAFAFIIEAAEQSELPENVLCSFQIHSIHLEDCPLLLLPSQNNNNDIDAQ